jgi:predicted component of type VI protein secretion system
MEARLVVEQGRNRNRVVRLLPPEIVIGRQRGCGVRIPSAEVSRRHCVLRIEDGYLTIQDLRSVNGTFLNGMRVMGREIVRPGDHLEIGPLRFVVEYELTPEALDRLSQFAAAAYVQPVEEVEEVEPVEEVDKVVEAVEVVDDPDQPIPVDDVQSEPSNIPDFEIGEADQWYVPPANELRDILSQLDDPQPQSKKRR